MVTIKSYSDLEQSKKLAEILSLESADYTRLGKDEDNVLTRPYFESFSSELKEWIGKDAIYPCWSLAALLSILPDYTLQTNTDGTVFVVCESKKPIMSDAYDNPIDACYEMVLKLHELNLL